jgi:hypothetical protein
VRSPVLALFVAVSCFGGAREFGLAEYRKALEERGLKPERHKIAAQLDSGPPESYQIRGALVTGGDLRGLMFGLLEAAHQIRTAGHLKTVKVQAAMPARAVRIRRADLPDGEALREFLRLLAVSRFNTLVIVPEPDELVRSAAAEFALRVKGPEESALVLKPVEGEKIAELVWCDPIYAGRLLAARGEGAADGVEIPARLPLGRHWFYYMAWGRMSYDPYLGAEERKAAWLPEFRKRFGAAAADVMEAITEASRAIHLEPERRFLVDGVEAVRLRIANTASARITPVERAVAYQQLWLRASAAMARADSALGKDHSEWTAIRTDLDKYLKHAQFQLRLAMAEDGHSLFVETGHDSGYYLAERSYRGAAALAKELAGTGLGLAHLLALTGNPEPAAEPARWPARPPRPDLRHSLPAKAKAGGPLTLSVHIPPSARADRIRLHWRDGGEWQTVEQPASRPHFTITPSREDAHNGSCSAALCASNELLYYFEVLQRADSGWFLPDPMSGPPYFRGNLNAAN